MYKTYLSIGRSGNFECSTENPDVFKPRRDSADGVLLYSMRSKRYFTLLEDGSFGPGEGSSLGVVGLGNGTCALMLPQ